MFSTPLDYGLSRAAVVSRVTFITPIRSLDFPDDCRLGAWISTVARRHIWRLMERRHEDAGEGEDLAKSATLVDDSDGAESL